MGSDLQDSVTYTKDDERKNTKRGPLKIVLCICEKTVVDILCFMFLVLQ